MRRRFSPASASESSTQRSTSQPCASRSRSAAAWMWLRCVSTATCQRTLAPGSSVSADVTTKFPRRPVRTVSATGRSPRRKAAIASSDSAITGSGNPRHHAVVARSDSAGSGRSLTAAVSE